MPQLRLTVLTCAVLLYGAPYAAPLQAQQAPWPTNGWAVSTPAEQGLDGTPFERMHARIAAGDFGNVDRMVVVRNGYLVVNRRYENDYRRISQGHRGILGCGVGSCRDSSEIDEYNYFHPDRHPYHRGRDVHSLQSVTKSVTATLIGIAIGRGEIAGTDVPLLSFLGDYDLSRVEARLHRATLDDLLTMRSGIEWHETDRPIDSTNTTFQLEASHDWVQFTLDQPMDADPGTKWAYSSGGSQLMSAVIRTATGRLVDAYAEEHLFGPLGIREYHWKRTPAGLPDTEGGLYLEAEQLAKIGYLYLQDGMWDDQRVLPVGWVAAATARQVQSVNAAGWGYGYQWWRIDRNGTDVWAGLGFGGQFLYVIPDFDIVGVINSWNVFGGSQAGILMPFLDAMLASASQ